MTENIPVVILDESDEEVKFLSASPCKTRTPTPADTKGTAPESAPASSLAEALGNDSKDQSVASNSTVTEESNSKADKESASQNEVKVLGAKISTSVSGEIVKAEQPVSPTVSEASPFNAKFFLDLADAIALSFPYHQFAEEHGCTIGDVNDALLATIVGPLMSGKVVEDHSQIEKVGRSMIDKWRERYLAMQRKLEKESNGKHFPMEFEEILVAASYGAETYWKTRPGKRDQSASDGIRKTESIKGDDVVKIQQVNKEENDVEKGNNDEGIENTAHAEVQQSLEKNSRATPTSSNELKRALEAESVDPEAKATSNDEGIENTAHAEIQQSVETNPRATPPSSNNLKRACEAEFVDLEAKAISNDDGIENTAHAEVQQSLEKNSRATPPSSNELKRAREAESVDLEAKATSQSTQIDPPSPPKKLKSSPPETATKPAAVRPEKSKKPFKPFFLPLDLDSETPTANSSSPAKRPRRKVWRDCVGSYHDVVPSDEPAITGYWGPFGRMLESGEIKVTIGPNGKRIFRLNKPEVEEESAREDDDFWSTADSDFTDNFEALVDEGDEEAVVPDEFDYVE
ncbi:hypothetical protein PRK78_001980 [Emydomyces testavorans]|uniref:Uncharacterized protein n=1 Tax=Emydomyces testavorans TaxID=2070801 RepID=A0AAF0IJ74_9EURO|nr:hypothetical protein PRK78_001980 [Emydomyces testavorans]